MTCKLASQNPKVNFYFIYFFTICVISHICETNKIWLFFFFLVYLLIATTNSYVIHLGWTWSLFFFFLFQIRKQKGSDEHLSIERSGGGGQEVMVSWHTHTTTQTKVTHLPENVLFVKAIEQKTRVKKNLFLCLLVQSETPLELSRPYSSWLATVGRFHPQWKQQG